MDIQERIKLVRNHFDMSQEQFGDALGVSRSVIANIEYDRLKRPDQKEPVYRLICEKFGINEQWLRTGEGEMFRILPEEDELSVYIEELLMGTDDSVHKALRAFLLAYGRMNDPSKKVMNELIDNWLEEMKKERD